MATQPYSSHIRYNEPNTLYSGQAIVDVVVAVEVSTATAATLPPTISTGTTQTPAVITAAVATLIPALSLGSIYISPVIAATVATSAPTLSLGVTYVVGLIAATATSLDPVVLAGTLVEGSLSAATATTFNPTIIAVVLDPEAALTPLVNGFPEPETTPVGGTKRKIIVRKNGTLAYHTSRGHYIKI